MRVLLVAPPWSAVPPPAYGGIEWVVAGLADGLVEAGHEVTLVASGGSCTKARLHTVFEDPPFARMGEAVFESLQALEAYRLRHGFDVIHDHTGSVGPALGALVDGPPVVHTLHGAWTDEQTRLARLITPSVRLVAISRDQAVRAPADVPISAVVHNGIPVERYTPRFDKDGFLLYVGRADPSKGPATAIEIARMLDRPLVMAVKVNDPPEQRYWRDVIEPKIASVPNLVTVVPNPPHDVKADLMARADVLVNPIAWAEPFGLVMPEANASGTPVAAYAIGSAPEVVEDGVTGVLAPPGDVAALAAAVDRCASLDPGTCRRRAVERFSMGCMVDRYLRVYRSLALTLEAS